MEKTREESKQPKKRRSTPKSSKPVDQTILQYKQSQIDQLTKLSNELNNNPNDLKLIIQKVQSIIQETRNDCLSSHKDIKKIVNYAVHISSNMDRYNSGK